MIRNNHIEEDHVVRQHVTWNFNTEDHIDGWYVIGNITIKDHDDEHHMTDITAVQQQPEDSGSVRKLNKLR